jgi:hypothetical protein
VPSVTPKTEFLVMSVDHCKSEVKNDKRGT